MNIQTLTPRQRFLLILTPILVFILFIFILTIYTRYTYEPPIPEIYIEEEVIEFVITEDAKFVVDFNESIPPHAADNINIELVPDVNFQLEWQGRGDLLITPFPSLEKGVDYKVIAYYKDTELASRSFSVNPFSLEELNVQGELQARDDIDFSVSSREMRREFPWYDSLPIDTDKFVIVYDYDLEQFRIRLKIPESSDQELIDSYTEQALNILGVLSSVPEGFEYYVVFQNN